MPVSKEDVDNWFLQNPNATNDQVAAAVQSIGGLDANANLAGILADRYGVNASEVQNYYNAFAPAEERSASLPVAQRVTTPTVTFTEGLEAKTPTDIAAEYNTLLNSGFSDAEIRAAADTKFGVQSVDDWTYLTNLASGLKPVTNTVTPTTATVTPTVTPTVAPTVGPTVDNLTLANSFDFSNTGIAGLNNANLTGLNAIKTDGGGTNNGTTTVATNTADVIQNLTNQILNQGTTQYWSGEGFGSTAANAADMARLLNTIGVTNINDFGLVTTKADVGVTPVYDYRMEDRGGEEGIVRVPYIVGYTDKDGKPVDPSLVTVGSTMAGSGDNSYYESTYTAPIGTQQVYGNTKTGQVLDAQYDRADMSRGIFSGTFAGDDSTHYSVKFRPDGTPVFYTRQGETTNSLAQVMNDLGPFGQVAFAVATGGLSIPQQIAANLALSVLSGKDLDNAILNAAVSFAGSQIPGMDIMKDVNSFITDLGLSKELTNTLTQAVNNAAVSGGTALLTGENPVDAALRGAATGGVGGAVNSILGNVEGFSGLTAAQQKIVTNAVTGAISGKPLDQVVINAAIATAKNEIKNASTTPTTTPTTNIISVLENNGLTETNLSDANLFNTGEKITVSADAQNIIDDLSAIKSDELAFVGSVGGLGSAAAAETAALLQRVAGTPAGQEALRQAAAVSTTVRDALIASGIFTAAGVASFITGNQVIPAKIETTTKTGNSDLVSQIPTDSITSLVNGTITPTTAVQTTAPTTAVQTVTTKPTTQVSTSPSTYVVQPGDYTDTTEELEPWQTGTTTPTTSATTTLTTADASRLADMLGVDADTAANLLRIYPGLLGQDDSFIPADTETMTSTNLRLLESSGGGADDNIVVQKPSNDTVVARDIDGNPITYGDLVSLTSTRPTTTPTTQVVPTTQVTNQVTTTPTTETTTRATPTTEVTTEVVPTTVTEATTTTTPTTEVVTEVTPTTTPTTEIQTTTTPTTRTEPTTGTQTTTTPTTATQATVTPTTGTQTTVTPTTATQATVTPTTATQTTVTPTTATQTTVKPTTATQATVTPTTATQTTTTPTTATQTTVTPTTATQTTVTPTTATQTTTTPTTATQTTVTPTTATQTTTTPTTATQTTTTPTTATQTTVTPTVTPTVATVTPTVATVTPTVATVTPTQPTQPTTTVTPTATPTVTPTATTTVKPTVATVKPTVKSTVSGYTMPQAQNIAAAFGMPALANVFYYGKDFSSKKQKLDKKGEIEEEEYKPLSVTAPGAMGELVEEQKTKENNADDALDLILGKSNDSMSVDELLNIVKGG